MSHPSRSTTFGTRIGLAALLLGTLVAATAAFGAGAAGATPTEPATPTWRVYLSLQPVDAAGNPSLVVPAGATLTITAAGTTATCTQTADAEGLTCDHPDTGFLVTRGTGYHVTATNLPAGWTAGNVGAFTTESGMPGPQCTPNHGGYVDPCHHTVTAGPNASDAVETSSGTVARVLPGATNDSTTTEISVETGDGGTEPATPLTADTGSATASQADAADVEGTAIAASDRPAARQAGMTAASVVALPDTSNATTVLVMACAGLLGCGAAAFGLVHSSRRQRPTG